MGFVAGRLCVNINYVCEGKITMFSGINGQVLAMFAVLYALAGLVLWFESREKDSESESI